MSKYVDQPAEIPDAPYYVTMIDPFFGGWGPAEEVGEETVAIYIAPCDSGSEAKIVYDNAIGRGDQQSIQIVSEKPIPGEGQHVRIMDRASYGNWYSEGHWPNDGDDAGPDDDAPLGRWPGGGPILPGDLE